MLLLGVYFLSQYPIRNLLRCNDLLLSVISLPQNPICLPLKDLGQALLFLAAQFPSGVPSKIRSDLPQRNISILYPKTWKSIGRKDNELLFKNNNYKIFKNNIPNVWRWASLTFSKGLLFLSLQHYAISYREPSLTLVRKKEKRKEKCFQFEKKISYFGDKFPSSFFFFS